MTIELPTVPLRVIRLAAADADLDARTVARVVIGAPVRPICRERAIAALTKLGVELPQIGTIAAGAAATTTKGP